MYGPTALRAAEDKRSISTEYKLEITLLPGAPTLQL
jgi:hypothetical protein